MHRSDESGTTENFTDYLDAGRRRRLDATRPTAWPIKGGEAAQGTSGVVPAVSEGDGTIGYADESQAGDLGVVAIKVGDEFVAPDRRGRRQGRRRSRRRSRAAPTDMAIDIDRTTTEAGAYPMVLVSYLIACQNYDDEARPTWSRAT